LFFRRFKEGYSNDSQNVSAYRCKKAFQLAKLYESTYSSNIYTKILPKIQKTHFTTTAILPTTNPIHKALDSQLHLSTNQRQLNKKLTPAFMAERRSRGLYYFCDEPYSPAHALAHKA